MSASSSPVCGRASRGFSILTVSAGRTTSSVVATPVSGQTGGTSGLGGAALAAMTVGVAVTAGGVTSAWVAALPHPARSRDATETTLSAIARRRRRIDVRDDRAPWVASAATVLNVSVMGDSLLAAGHPGTNPL